MIGEEEIAAQCPYCFSKISFVCEIISGGQAYIEDCEVCCKPIQISYEADANNEMKSFLVRRLDE